MNPRPARVVEANQRSARFDRHIHNLANLFSVHLTQAAAEHGEVLREHVYQPPVNRAPASHHAVAQRLPLVESEIVCAMSDESVHLAERSAVEQEFKPLARREPPAFVSGLDALQPAAHL